MRLGNLVRGFRRPRVLIPMVAAIVLVIVVAAVLWYVTAEQRRPVKIIGATVVGDSLILEVDSCGGEPEVTDIDQGPSEVRVTVEASTRVIGSARECADSIAMRLQSPLGARLVVDATRGEPVEVQGR